MFVVLLIIVIILILKCIFFKETFELGLNSINEIKKWNIRKGYIFVSVPSFVDERCKSTIRSLFKNAAQPDKIVVGVCEQNKVKEDNCIDSPITKGEIRLISINALEARGPCIARQKVSTLWRGEEIYLQIDAHSFFAKDWDIYARNMWNNRTKDKVVFSTYPVDRDHEDDKLVESDVPVICDINMTGKTNIKQLATKSHKPGKVTTSRTIGGGYLLTEGRALYNVPLDPTLLDTFQGEELLWAARLYTHGYDLLTPSYNIVSHNYKRKRETSDVHNTKNKEVNFEEGNKHMISILKQDLSNERAKLSIENGYGFGQERTLDDFFKEIQFNLNIIGDNKQNNWEFNYL